MSAHQPKILLYIAASIDGYIATSDGGIEWLHPYEGGEYGYQDFMDSVGTVVVGRTTYDQALGFNPWPYGGKKTIVVTSTPLSEPAPENTTAFCGSLSQLASQLKMDETQHIWLVGGGKLIQGFLECAQIDEIELFIIPVLLGQGIPLFPPFHNPIEINLETCNPYPNGVVRLVYNVKKAN